MVQTFDLNDRDAAFIKELVRAGRYRWQDAVLRDSLELMRAREERLAELDPLLDEGLASADAGELRDATKCSMN